MPSLALTPARHIGFPADLEDTFREAHARDSLSTVRTGIWIALVLYAAFGMLNPWTVPDITTQAWILQYAVVCPLLFIGWAMTYVPFVLEHLHQLFSPIIALGVLIAGGGIVLLTALVSPTNIGGLAYSGVLVLVIIFAYSAVRMPFVWATGVNWILVISYVAAAFGFQHGMAINTRLGAIVFLSNVAILVGANLIGMFACYTLEYYARLDFLQKRSIRKEKDTSEKLLLNILPREVANRLKKSNDPIAQDYPEATLLFADICNFTPLSGSMTPLALLKLLNEVFTAFDEIVDRHGGEKIKTIGDCYMVTVGVPTPTAGHARIATRIAMEMQEYLQQRAAARRDGTHVLSMRTGIHSGPVVAGVIGHRKFIYDLWGDTVNIASRMESHSEPGRIQITRASYERIKDEFDCEARGTINIKGKGEMETWFITGRRAQSLPG